MTDLLHDLADQYAAALRRYLQTPDEADLNEAYEFGRLALSASLGVLDMATLHHGALWPAIAAGGPSKGGAQMSLAAEFFAESLSPFEMSLRGFREANSRLLALNEVLQRAKAATEAANRELEAFSYSAAHDLRAPLRSIDGFSQALLEDCGEALDAQGQGYLHRVRAAAQRMGELIDGLLALARVGRGELQHAPIDLAEIARDVMGQLQRATPTRNVMFACSDSVAVQGDPGLLRAVLENLLSNAWKFTAKKSQAQIEFGINTDSDQRVFFVRDNGAGFDMAYADKLFGVFQRLHSASDFEGTGVGLATVRRIVERHGGRIWAQADVDKGAAFYWTLSDENGG